MNNASPKIGRFYDFSDKLSGQGGVLIFCQNLAYMDCSSRDDGEQFLFLPLWPTEGFLSFTFFFCV